MNNIDLTKLQKEIDVTVSDLTLLQNAFIHRSYLNEHKDSGLLSNEKLEFLGDSVLSLATSIYLYTQYPQYTEGEYTDIKAKIVRMETLADTARTLSLGEYLMLSAGEQANNGRDNSNILADCFEALIAVIFIDKGFDTANTFITKYLYTKKVDTIVKHKLYLAPKSRLQELAQDRYRETPTYTVAKEDGPEHNKLFTVEVYLQHKIIATGVGKSKKIAEESAAQKAIELLEK